MCVCTCVTPRIIFLYGRSSIYIIRYLEAIRNEYNNLANIKCFNHSHGASWYEHVLDHSINLVPMIIFMPKPWTFFIWCYHLPIASNLLIWKCAFWFHKPPWYFHVPFYTVDLDAITMRLPQLHKPRWYHHVPTQQWAMLGRQCPLLIIKYIPYIYGLHVLTINSTPTQKLYQTFWRWIEDI